MGNLIIKPNTGGELKLQEDGGTDAIAINTSGGVSGAAIKDEDAMGSDSATHLATQQSIKAYVDSAASRRSYVALSLASTVNNVTGDGTAYILNWGAAVTDRDTAWDGSTTFEAKATGVYLWAGYVEFVAISGSSTVTLDLIVAGTSAKTYRLYNRGSTSPALMYVSIAIEMTVTDTAAITVTGSGGGK